MLVPVNAGNSRKSAKVFHEKDATLISKMVCLLKQLVGGWWGNPEADFISLCHPLIREPGLINDWKRGDTHRATCVSGNKCGAGSWRGKASGFLFVGLNISKNTDVIDRLKF